MNSKKHFVASAFALVLTAALAVVNADSEDHIVVLRGAQTLEQVVKKELLSSRFAKQIAEYNNLNSISDVLPAGTSVRIPQPYMENRNFGKVAFVKGDVVHTQRRLVVNPPSKGSMVYSGDIITTGEDGFVSLAFNSGASVNLQPESRVSIAALDCVDTTVKCVISLDAERGAIQSEVTPRPEGQPPVSFKVNTPFLSAAVRGTAFYVNVEEGADRVGVTRGSVDADAAGNAHELPSGTGLLAAAGVEPAVVDLLPEPNLLLDTDRVIISNEDIVSWEKLSGAELYQFTIATDESLSAPVLVEQFRANNIQPNLNTPGKYFLAVAGVDTQKFAGIPTVTDFHYASIDDQALALDIERAGSVVSITTPEYDGTIELLVSSGIDSKDISRRFVEGASEGLEVTLDPSQDWALQARKVLSETSVSAYGNQYLLEAIK